MIKPVWGFQTPDWLGDRENALQAPQPRSGRSAVGSERLHTTMRKPAGIFRTREIGFQDPTPTNPRRKVWDGGPDLTMETTTS